MAHPQPRICQGDIFKDIEVIEHLEPFDSKLRVQKLWFPYVICLNQECDLESDFQLSAAKNSDGNLLHLAIAPMFIFEQFLNGSHWGDIFTHNKPQRRGDTSINKITSNEIPRYHYIKFLEPDMPEFIVDFKHFFTVNRNLLYAQLDKRVTSIEDLFKEKISQRFSYYISRIGLPEFFEDKT